LGSGSCDAVALVSELSLQPVSKTIIAAITATSAPHPSGDVLCFRLVASFLGMVYAAV
jgi:hypothetical protein